MRDRMSKHDRASKGAVVVALGGLALSTVMGVRLHKRAVERAHARMAAQRQTTAAPCASQPDARVAPPTGNVVEQTRWVSTEGAERAAVGYDGETAGFSPSGRWAVVRLRDEASTLFVDVNTRTAHAIAGVRFVTTSAPSSTIVSSSDEESWGSSTERSAPRFSADERFAYGFVGGSLRVFDIEAHTNTVLDELNESVEPSANGRSLAWPCHLEEAHAVCFYDFASASLRRVALPAESSELHWLDNELLAVVPARAEAGPPSSPSSLFVLSAYTGAVESYGGDAVHNVVELSSDGRYLAAQRTDNGLAVFRRGHPAPVYTWSDDEALGWKWQAGGAAIAWVHTLPEVASTGDESEAEADTERPNTIEVQWLDENRHTSTRTVGSCSIADEYITTFEGDELRTELECSPGCPSIAVHSDLRLYNAREGRFVRDLPSIDGPSPRDENDAQQRAVARMLRSAGAVGAGVQGHYDAAAGTLLVQHARGVTLVSRGRAPTRFQQTGDGTGWTMTRSADGARWLGVGPDSSAVIWDAATGLVRWTSRDGDEQGC